MFKNVNEHARVEISGRLIHFSLFLCKQKFRTIFVRNIAIFKTCVPAANIQRDSRRRNSWQGRCLA